LSDFAHLYLKKKQLCGVTHCTLKHIWAYNTRKENKEESDTMEKDKGKECEWSISITVEKISLGTMYRIHKMFGCDMSHHQTFLEI
jgi:hypothetical protein